MEFFGKLGNTISTAGKDGLNKAKELKDIAKLALDIKEREGSIQRMYRELGKAYYQEHKDDETPAFEQILAIGAAFEEIAELRAMKDDLQGIKRCACCGSPVAITAKFCSNCGEAVPVEEEVEVEETEEVTEEEIEIVAEEASEDLSEDEEEAAEEVIAEEASEETEA